MSNRPLPLAFVELGMPSVDGFAAAHARHVDVQRAAARRRPTEHVRLSGAQFESHRPISRVAQQQRWRAGQWRQRRPAAFITDFRVRTDQGAAAPIYAAQTAAYRNGLHGLLTQSNRSARLIRPEM
jgi:hypothetical protein